MIDRDEIIRMAREAGAVTGVKDHLNVDGDSIVFVPEELESFAALVAAAERQRLHDKFMQIHQSQQHSNNYWHFAARKIKEEA